MTTPIPFGEHIKMQSIGSLDSESGTDYYVLLTRIDNDMTPNQASNWLIPRVFVAGKGPGSMFCNSVLATPVQYSTNAVICTVQHRYDI